MEKGRREIGILKIDAEEKIFPIGDLYGVSFEDINHAVDGGLYAEMVRNRSFEYEMVEQDGIRQVASWRVKGYNGGSGSLTIEEKEPFNQINPHYGVLTLGGTSVDGSGQTGILNEGYNTGFSLKKGQKYYYSFYARRSESFDENVFVRVENEKGKAYCVSLLNISTDKWKKYEGEFVANETASDGRLVIVTSGKGKVYFDHVSLFSEHTFKKHKNGMREDLAQVIADFKPKFLRFPVGHLVKSGSEKTYQKGMVYSWKSTVGPIEERPVCVNKWGYHQTLGVGVFERFQFCQDIGAKPIPVFTIPAEEQVDRQLVEFWIQEILDLIEFAMGDESVTWGKKRIQLGHIKPFRLEYLIINCEEKKIKYMEILNYLYAQIKKAYPKIQIISAFYGDGDRDELKECTALDVPEGTDYIDRCYHQKAEWFIQQYHRFDQFERDGSRFSLGGFSSRDNKFRNALMEAAFMTGINKNSDIIQFVCYEPLLCNKDYINQTPDLIWYDNHRIARSINYYAHKLFCNFQGEYSIVSTLEGGEKRRFEGMEVEPLYYSTEINEKKREIYLKAVNVASEDFDVDIYIEADKRIDPSVLLVDMDVEDIQLENTIDHPDVVIPKAHFVQFIDNKLKYKFKAHSISFFRIKYGK